MIRLTFASTRHLLGLTTLLLAATAGQAAIVIDFNSLTSFGTYASYTESGVTFEVVPNTDDLTAAGGSPNGTIALVGGTDFGNLAPIRADISGGATFVSIDLGDFNQDADTLFLEVYDSGDNLLGSVTQFIDDTFVGYQTLSFTTPNIAYAVFGTTAPSVGGSSIYADNFTFEPTVVPEPGTLGLLALGVVGLVRRRRRA